MYVTTLACAHLFLTLSPWTAPAFGGRENGTAGLAWLMVLLGGWIVAGAVDVAMGLMEMLPLSFAGEAEITIACLAVLLIAGGASLPFYFLCAVTGPVLVLVKAFEEFTGLGRQPRHA
jgi:hypothetical protein